MKKKILAGVGVLVLAVIAMGAWVVLVDNKRSPIDTVTHSVGGVDVKVVYCRPYKKGRLIFGEEAANALVPLGQYWRLGANAATEISFAKGISFAGKPVAAGTYRMYAVPGAAAWKVVLNSDLGWGAAEADHTKDVLSVEVPVETTPGPLEQFTIAFSGAPTATKMDFAWDTTLVRVPIAAN